MKATITTLLQAALAELQNQSQIHLSTTVDVEVTPTRDPSHGDWASNVALGLAKVAGKPPRQLAEMIIAALPAHEAVRKVEIAGPGFINFFVAAADYRALLAEILQQGAGYGRSQEAQGQKVQVEFVSANPNGPLHVGHGRGAAYGATLSNLLEAIGYDVKREYYVNDAGRQMDILTVSVWLRYLQAQGESLTFPANGYKGDYVRDMAATLQSRYGNSLQHSSAIVFSGIPIDEPQGGDKEKHIDALIQRARQLLGAEHYADIFKLALETQVADIRDDLLEFGVRFDQWFSERSLTDNGDVQAAIQQLRAGGYLYDQDGAVWFRATQFGDEKDRVLVRDNGVTTYFASDAAYVLNKLQRGFDKLIYVLGADHHGYIPRLRAVATALGADADKLQFSLVQFVVLFRNGEKQQMSTRSGEFITLRELREEVGTDAARFFYVMRRCEQHLEFDLDLATSQSKDNPVYYLQYAHARICSVFRQLDNKGFVYQPDTGLAQAAQLSTAHEQEVLKKIAQYPETLATAARKQEPHLLINYLRELANSFHSYYNEHTILLDDAELRNARLVLSKAVQHIIANGLLLIGVSAPERM